MCVCVYVCVCVCVCINRPAFLSRPAKVVTFSGPRHTKQEIESVRAEFGDVDGSSFRSAPPAKGKTAPRDELLDMMDNL